VLQLAGEVAGEARDAAHQWFATAMALAGQASGPVCVISAGETTVHVTGGGRGGRNQEFVLALAEAAASVASEVVVASVGTDGIDGPTDAAGAIVDNGTASRAAALGLTAGPHLAGNNAYAFFEPLNDLIRLGRTDTNVGDIQLLLTSGRRYSGKPQPAGSTSATP
jgi:hydroxypyruvate reductase